MPKVTASGPSVASERVAEDAEETAEAPEAPQSAEAQAAPDPPSWVPPRQA